MGSIQIMNLIEDKKQERNLSNTVKYIAKAGKMDSKKRSEYLLKAIWYLNRHIKLME